MEQIIRLVLLTIGAIVVLWILYDGIKRQKRLRGEVHAGEDANDTDETAADSHDEKIEYAFERVEENTPNLDIVDEIKEDVSDEMSDDKANIVDDVIMLMIVPEKGQVFSGGVLLQTLFSHDLHFGDQQIFHYYSVDSNNLDKPLFSVTSASASGEFDLNSMRENSYRGLVAFMQPAKHLHPADVFDMMVEVAGNVAADLQGKLLSGDQQPWSDEVAAKVRATI
ncbi:MAG: cell division protein ZipA C-terminal FtsZ-binding domain-containing protein [Gammaproteobacteria bacterium]|jgi:FtsZ-interacting cell division protein ZipA